MKPVRKAVFPVAGLGTRFLPATKSIPKEMLPVVDKPLIQYAVEEALEAGIDTLIFITSRKKHAISDHFDSAFELQTMTGLAWGEPCAAAAGAVGCEVAGVCAEAALARSTDMIAAAGQRRGQPPTRLPIEVSIVESWSTPDAVQRQTRPGGQVLENAGGHRAAPRSLNGFISVIP